MPLPNTNPVQGHHTTSQQAKSRRGAGNTRETPGEGWSRSWAGAAAGSFSSHLAPGHLQAHTVPPKHPSQDNIIISLAVFLPKVSQARELSEHPNSSKVFGQAPGCAPNSSGRWRGSTGVSPLPNTQGKEGTDRQLPGRRQPFPGRTSGFPAEPSPRTGWVSSGRTPRLRRARRGHQSQVSVQPGRRRSRRRRRLGAGRGATLRSAGSARPARRGPAARSDPGRGAGTAEGCTESWEAGKRGRLGGSAGQWEAQSMMSPRSSQHGSG